MKTGGRADGNGGLVAGLGGVRTGEQITPPLGGCGGDAPSGYELCFWTILAVLARCTLYRKDTCFTTHWWVWVCRVRGHGRALNRDSAWTLHDGQVLWLRISQGGVVGSPRRTIVAWNFRGGPDVGPRLGRAGPRFGRGQAAGGRHTGKKVRDLLFEL